MSKIPQNCREFFASLLTPFIWTLCLVLFILRRLTDGLAVITWGLQQQQSRWFTPAELQRSKG